MSHFITERPDKPFNREYTNQQGAYDLSLEDGRSRPRPQTLNNIDIYGFPDVLHSFFIGACIEPWLNTLGSISGQCEEILERPLSREMAGVNNDTAEVERKTAEVNTYL